MTAFVGQGCCQRADLESTAARLPPAFRDQRARRAHQIVQVVQDGTALDQHPAVVEHQGGHAPQRVVGGDQVGVAERRRDAVATVERKLIRATGGGRLIGQYRTCAFTVEATNVIPLRRR